MVCGHHSGARLKMEQACLEREREKTEEEVIAHFQRWLKNPEVRDLICQNYISPEERERRLREIFGLAPKPPAQSAPIRDESNPVKPKPTPSDRIKPNQRESRVMAGHNPNHRKPVCPHPSARRLA